MENNDVAVSVIGDIAGNDVLPLINVLKGKRNVSEFTIAEELKEEINTVRNKLYRLYDSNLVEFIRRKDKKKGWYIYYWTFVPSRVPFLLKAMNRKRIEKLKERLMSEKASSFFECKQKCVRLTFDKAIDFEFKCPECGDLMNQDDNAERIEHILKEILMLEKETEDIPKITVETPNVDVEEDFDEEEDAPEDKAKIASKHPKVKSKKLQFKKFLKK